MGWLQSDRPRPGETTSILRATAKNSQGAGCYFAVCGHEHDDFCGVAGLLAVFPLYLSPKTAMTTTVARAHSAARR
jgi:hypothetical protein